jgi:hypothetical protein
MHCHWQIEMLSSLNFVISLTINILILLAFSVVFLLPGSNADGHVISRSDQTARLEVSDSGSAPLSANFVRTLVQTLGIVQAVIASVIWALHISNFGALALGTRLVFCYSKTT